MSKVGRVGRVALFCLSRLIGLGLLVLCIAGCNTQLPPLPPTPTAVPTPTTAPPTATRPAPTPTSAPSATPAPTTTPAPLRATLGLNVASRRFPITMAVREARLEDNSLTLELSFFNSGSRDLVGSTQITGADATLVADGALLEPRDVSPSLLGDIGPTGRWIVGTANRGQVTFDRPRGDAATFRLPGFPPVQIDFRAGSAVAIADDGLPMPTPTPNVNGQTLADLRSLLLQLESVIRAGDSKAYSSVVSPDTAGAFGTPADPVAFVRNIPFSRFELNLLGNDLSAVGQVEMAQGQPVAVRNALVAIVYAIKGADNELFRQLMTADFVRQANGWQITRLTLDRENFWTAGLSAQTRTPHFIAFHRPGNDVTEVLTAAEQAHANLSAQLGDLVDAVNILIIADSRDLFTSLTQHNGENFVGSARFDMLLTTTGVAIVSRALYINDAAFSAGGLVNTRTQTVQHELTHLALSRWSRLWTPPWLIEGAAGVFAGEANTPPLKTYLQTHGPDKISLAVLTGLESLDQGPVPVSVAYAYSTGVSEAIIERFGLPKYLELYRAFSDIPVERVRQAAGAGASVPPERFRELQKTVTTEVLSKVLGLTLSELEEMAEARMLK